MPNKFKFLILIFAIILLSFPEHASADMLGIMDIFSDMKGGIEENTGPMFDVLLNVLIFFGTGLGFLWLSSSFLDFFISQQEQWMANLEPMTMAGWNFTVGLSNMLLILIFLFIAFGFILKIENIQSKKALPRLLGVAILINFSWVFVKMLVDITQIIYNTILPENNFFSMIMETIFGSAVSATTSILSLIGATTISWFIPVANTFTQFIFSTLFNILLFPNIIIWFIQAIFFWILAPMLLSFAFLFAARVFVIQILGILAPLAFLSLILPQTKSFWSKWYKFLIEWLLLGIFFLFFLVLGFGVVKLLAPTGWKAVMIPGFSMFNFGGQIIYYFALSIYMAVILLIGKKFIPEGAQQLIDAAKGLAGTVLTRGLVPYGKAMKKNVSNFATAQNQRENDYERTGGFDKTVAGMSKMNRFAAKAGRWTRRGVDLGHKMAGTTLNEENSKEIAETAAEAEKINDPNLLQRKIEAARKAGNINREMALTTKGISKGKGFKKLLQDEENIDKSRIISMANLAHTMGRPDQAEALARGYDHIIDEKDLSSMGFKMKDGEMAKYGSIRGKIFAKSKGDELKQYKEESLVDEKTGLIPDEFLQNLSGTHMGALATEFNSFADGFNKTAEVKTAKWFFDNNTRPLVYATGNAAGETHGYKPVDGLDKNMIKKIIKRRGEQKNKEKSESKKATQEPKAQETTESKEKTKVKIKMQEREESLEEMMKTGTQRDIDETDQKQAGERAMRDLEVLKQEEIQQRDEKQKTTKENDDKKAKQMNEELEALRRGEEPPESGTTISKKNNSPNNPSGGEQNKPTPPSEGPVSEPSSRTNLNTDTINAQRENLLNLVNEYKESTEGNTALSLEAGVKESLENGVPPSMVLRHFIERVIDSGEASDEFVKKALDEKTKFQEEDKGITWPKEYTKYDVSEVLKKYPSQQTPNQQLEDETAREKKLKKRAITKKTNKKHE